MTPSEHCMDNRSRIRLGRSRSGNRGVGRSYCILWVGQSRAHSYVLWIVRSGNRGVGRPYCILWVGQSRARSYALWIHYFLSSLIILFLVTFFVVSMPKCCGQHSCRSFHAQASVVDLTRAEVSMRKLVLWTTLVQKFPCTSVVDNTRAEEYLFIICY